MYRSRCYVIARDASTGQVVWIPDEFDAAFNLALEQQFGPPGREDDNPHRGPDGVIRCFKWPPAGRSDRGQKSRQRRRSVAPKARYP